MASGLVSNETAVNLSPHTHTHTHEHTQTHRHTHGFNHHGSAFRVSDNVESSLLCCGGQYGHGDGWRFKGMIQETKSNLTQSNKTPSITVPLNKLKTLTSLLFQFYILRSQFYKFLPSGFHITMCRTTVACGGHSGLWWQTTLCWQVSWGK